MSLYLDQKYLSLISNRLPLFAKKKDNLYNCRCILCGDSVKKVRKARGYFFPHKNSLMYKCHNCDASMFFSTFLKSMDESLYQQYSFENYAEGKPLTAVAKEEIKFEQPVFKTKEETLLDKILDRLDTLPDDNEAVKFCLDRKIPREKFNRLYFIDNVKKVVQLNESYKELIKTEEPRLILPFFDDLGQLSGITCRALRGEALRYITVKVKEQTPLIFGVNEIDSSKPVYVVEGPIDSLFLDNAIAVASSALGKVKQLKTSDVEYVMVFDNQPRNKELCAIMNKAISSDYKIVIWPQTIQEKDINDMVLANRNVSKIIKENTFQGLEAKMKFIGWKRV